jgi:drug/metabolite transporter (DMT)-like permease
MMGPMQTRPRTLGMVFAAVLILVALISPIILLGESPGTLNLLLVAGIVLGLGLLIRRQDGTGSRPVGTVLAVVGGVSLVVLVALLAVLLSSWGP